MEPHKTSEIANVPSIAHETDKFIGPDKEGRVQYSHMAPVGQQINLHSEVYKPRQINA